MIGERGAADVGAVPQLHPGHPVLDGELGAVVVAPLEALRAAGKVVGGGRVLGIGGDLADPHPVGIVVPWN